MKTKQDAHVCMFTGVVVKSVGRAPWGEESAYLNQNKRISIKTIVYLVSIVFTETKVKGVGYQPYLHFSRFCFVFSTAQPFNDENG